MFRSLRPEPFLSSRLGELAAIELTRGLKWVASFNGGGTDDGSCNSGMTGAGIFFMDPAGAGAAEFTRAVDHPGRCPSTLTDDDALASSSKGGGGSK